MNFPKDIFNYIISYILNVHPLLLTNKRTYKLNYYIYLESNNIEVVKLTIEYGVKNFSWCIFSNNIEVVKFGIEKSTIDFKLYNYSNFETLVYLYENKYL